MRPTIVFCDFDGTIFDADIRLFQAPFYNRLTSKLLNRPDTAFVVTTGRYSWGPWTRLNYALTGMRRPDFIISGAGTFIIKLVNGEYIKDIDWEARMKLAFNKEAVSEKLVGLLHKMNASEHRNPNPYMIIVKLYGKTLNEASDDMKKIAEELEEFKVKVILSEQLFLPNSEHLYNGYALIVPHVAGKDTSSHYILDHYVKEHKQKLTMLTFGDASVDIPLLTMNPPHGVAKHRSYGLHLTPLARNTLAALKEEKRVYTVPTLLDGSAPKSLYNVLNEYYQSPRNSPYRAFLAPFETLIDKTIHPALTPNELTWKGLDDVRTGLEKGGLRGFVRVVKGHMLDAADGIRARRHPHLKTPDGQLLDVHADRMKEFESLMARNQPEVALSCILPSITRAQAEAMGKTVPELDPAGGSALTRTRRLLTSLFFYTIGQHNKSKHIDEQIKEANLATFHNRINTIKDFSWSVSNLKTYDRASLERLLLLVELLQRQSTQIIHTQNVKMPEIKEYLNIKVPAIRTQLKIPTPQINTTSW